MTITPMSPPSGTIRSFQPTTFADHLLGADTSTFIASMLDMRERALQGKETQNDRALIEGWLSECSSTRSVEIQKTYRRHIERFRAFVRGNQLEQVNECLLAPGDPEAIERFAHQLRDMVDRGELAVSTYNVVVAAISSFYKWCSQPTRRGFTGVPLSPVPSGIQLKKPKQMAKALSQEKLHSVYAGARNCQTSPSRRRDELVVRLVFLLGTRATETINLRWSDVVTTAKGLAINVRAETAKGKKERFIPIDGHQPTLDVLAGLRELQPESEWILPNLRQPNRHISRQGIWKLCRRSGATVGIKCWTHQLRHTHATQSYSLTKDPKLIQQTLGHSDISTTMDLYVDPTDGDSSTKYLE